MYADIQDFILLREEEGIIDYRYEDIYRYAGPRALIASALVFRLMKEAISDLCPDEIPMRKEFRIVSGHSGPGVRDGFEYLTRASSDGRYIVDASDAPRGAPPSAAGGYLFFRISHKGNSYLYSISPEVMGEEWFSQVKEHQEGSVSVEAHANYLTYKKKVSADILLRPNIFNIRTPVTSYKTSS